MSESESIEQQSLPKTETHHQEVDVEQPLRDLSEKIDLAKIAAVKALKASGDNEAANRIREQLQNSSEPEEGSEAQKNRLVELYKEKYRGRSIHEIPRKLTNLLAKHGVFTTTEPRTCGDGSFRDFHKQRETERRQEKLANNTR